jgi:hypothetical protein
MKLRQRDKVGLLRGIQAKSFGNRRQKPSPIDIPGRFGQASADKNSGIAFSQLLQICSEKVFGVPICHESRFRWSEVDPIRGTMGHWI